MKQQSLFTLLLLGITCCTYAQEYKIAKSSGTLKLNISGVTVEGYEGKEIVISGKKAYDQENDERAKGLRAISGSGFVDNTGLGLNITEEGNTVEINRVGRNTDGVIKILLPSSIAVSLTNASSASSGVATGFGISTSGRADSAFNRAPSTTSTTISGGGQTTVTTVTSSSTNTGTSTTNSIFSNYERDDIVLKNLKSEIEVSTRFNKIVLVNNTGPMNINSVHGCVEAVFGQDIKGPVSIASLHGYVDVAVPASTKANLDMSTRFGKLFAAEDFKIDLEKNEVGMVSYNDDRVKGTLNGGGTDLILKSNYGRIYLRNSNNPK